MREIYDAVIQVTDKRNGRQFNLKLEDCVFEFYERNGILEVSGKPLAINKNIADLPIRFRPFSRNMDGARYITTASSPSIYERFLESLQRRSSHDLQTEFERNIKYEQWLLTNPNLVPLEDIILFPPTEENLQKSWEDMMLTGVKQANK